MGVREGRRDLLRGRRPHALLECGARQLGARGREVRQGWIECFYAYMGLGPPETHWTLEHFQKYSEDDLMKDVFSDGHVDVAIFQPTYLKEWYKEGFNTTE